MCDVDERGRPRPQQVLGRGVVAQVGGDVGVDVRRERRVERGVTRAAADRDPPDRPVGIARRTYAPRRGGEARPQPAR